MGNVDGKIPEMAHDPRPCHSNQAGRGGGRSDEVQLGATFFDFPRLTIIHPAQEHRLELDEPGFDIFVAGDIEMVVERFPALSAEDMDGAVARVVDADLIDETGAFHGFHFR